MSNNNRREGWIQSDICTKKDNGRILGYTEDEIRANYREHIGGKKDEYGNPIDPTEHDEAYYEIDF